MYSLRLTYPIPTMSRMLDVSASGYYAWLVRPLSERKKDNARLELEIKAAHKRTRETYGPARLQHDLILHGIQAGICRIRRIRKKLGLRCKQKRKFKATTYSKHGLPVADNLLKQRFTANGPNQVWLSDITYIPTDEGWLYLAGHKDLFTHEIVGYAMGERMSKYLVGESLYKAMGLQYPEKGLMHHSDRGSQYCSTEYRQILKRYGVQVSMSGTGNCYDNAPMESFWGTLKQELVHHRHYATRLEAIHDITEYIEIFYNRQRIQSSLGFLAPALFARFYYQKQAGITAS
jgi:putative transposase